MNLLKAARQFSIAVHRDERLKYVIGPYYTHPKAVSERLRAIPEKVVALLHDAVESEVKRKLGKKPDPSEEERVIAEYFEYMTVWFKGRGCDISPLIPDINILTKRTSDTDYKIYVARIIAHSKATNSLVAVSVKLADLYDNSLPERNPPLNSQTDKDRARLARYAEAIRDIEDAFPGIELRAHPNDRPRFRDLPGHGRMNRAALSAREEAGSRGFTRRTKVRRHGAKKPAGSNPGGPR